MLCQPVEKGIMMNNTAIVGSCLTLSAAAGSEACGEGYKLFLKTQSIHPASYGRRIEHDLLPTPLVALPGNGKSKRVGGVVDRVLASSWTVTSR